MKPDIEYRPKKSGVVGRRRVAASAVGKGNDATPFEPVETDTLPSGPRSMQPSRASSATPSFNRTEYQRLYMRDRTQAQKLGLTVKQYREQNK